MAPRRSVGRNATATPARSTRANSAIPVDDSGARRSTRAATQQSLGVDRVDLREVQLQQSYGYGSKAAIRELDRLDASNRISKGRAADEIDADIEQARDRFETLLDQAQENLESSPPAGRTRRKTSRELSQEPSADPERTRTEKASRVAAWANSLESDQLEEIPEEDDEESEGQEDRARKDTEPSSFPSGIFDASYNLERGMRKPSPLAAATEQGPSTLQRLRKRSRDVGVAVRDKLAEIFQTVLDLFQRTLRAITEAILDIPESRAFAIGVKGLFGACCVAAVSVLFCALYSKLLCNPDSTSVVSQSLQKLCGSCTASGSVPLLDLSGAQQEDITRVSAYLQNLQKQIQLLESRLTQRFDSQQATLESEVEALKSQQIEMSSHLANLHIQRSLLFGEGIASPLLPKVNFFAPSNGALVDPKRSTPTKAKPQWLAKRVLMRVLQIKQTISKDPMTALEPWHDVGDCWCAASPDEGDYVRLHVSTNEYIYPTELVVEHFPFAGTRDPGTAPRDLELWADFSYMDKREKEQLQVPELQENSILDAGFARLGAIQYNASPGINHVQAFTLNVNQQGLTHYAKKFVFRVTSTYGADNACLYRVRLHGVPLDAAASAGERAQEYYQQGGYVLEGDN